MNTKNFLRNHGAKSRSASSTFISLHFNKSDEDQLEINYKDDKKAEKTINKNVSDVSQFFVATSDVQNPVDSLSETDSKEMGSEKKAPVLASDSTANISKVCADKLKKTGSANLAAGESSKCSSRPKTAESSQINSKIKSDTFLSDDVEQNNDVVDFHINATNHAKLLETDSELKLSPAIEVAETVDSDNFFHYVNNELEKAKCEILDLKKNKTPSSPKSKKHSESSTYPPIDSKTTDFPVSDQQESNCSKKSFKNSNYFYYVVQQSVTYMKWARNSVKFHVLIALLSCICAPIPSWLSGFLVGTILSGSIVYWLYKPQKNKKYFYNFNLASPRRVQTPKSQEESGILKGWMNELPSFYNYNPERYHVSLTRSVYVRLEGSYLRFSFPQKNIPKRAMFNEPRYEMQFIHQQHYDVTDAVVELLPKGLSNKRLWIKKYPICLRIPNSKEAVLFKFPQTSSMDSSFSSKTNKKENSSRRFMPRITENNEIVIYLFARTDRDKSLWFNRFLKASRMKIERSHSPTLYARISDNESFESKRNMSFDFAYLQNTSSELSETTSWPDDETDDSFVQISINKQQKFEMYMTALLAPLYTEHPFVTPYLRKEKTADKKEVQNSSNQSSLTWLNVLIGRLFFDFLIEDVWAQLVTAKIQKKLNRIKLPFFLAELSVKDIHLGSALPKIHRASDPSLDERGVWVDVDVSYNGSFHMTLETKLNLARFKADSEEFCSSVVEMTDQNEISEQTKSPEYISEEDSLESSSDDDFHSPPDINEDGSLKESSLPAPSGSTGKKLLKFVDKLAQSSYFQHAAKNKYVKKAMNDISNTPLVLTVEVQWLTGTLAINVPPWPTDRLWYGFRTNPSLCITARPKLGQHVVTFTHVTEWIEKKLTSEFQKLLVMPNMDDLIIPIMQPAQDVP